ncbi:hypothetical protein A4M19_000693 [Salmonella enterica subsp. diarizonae]|nr:hypothetical protein [Salmonella enterica subsp. diarizonae]
MSSGVTLSVTESDLYQALGDYLRGLFSDAGIERTQDYRQTVPILPLLIFPPVILLYLTLKPKRGV